MERQLLDMRGRADHRSPSPRVVSTSPAPDGAVKKYSIPGTRLSQACLAVPSEVTDQRLAQRLSAHHERPVFFSQAAFGDLDASPTLTVLLWSMSSGIRLAGGGWHGSAEAGQGLAASAGRSTPLLTARTSRRHRGHQQGGEEEGRRSMLGVEDWFRYGCGLTVIAPSSPPAAGAAVQAVGLPYPPPMAGHRGS